jgi:hypothetical protein
MFIDRFLAWFLIQHYQHAHKLKMYSACLNENPTLNSLTKAYDRTTANTSIHNRMLPMDSSMANIDLALFEATLKEASLSTRSATLSTTSASKQLIAAAHAARSLQQQQSVSTRAKADIDFNVRACHTAGVNTKTNALHVPVASSAVTSPYSSSLQKVARSNPIMKLIQEVSKQQCCQTCGTDKTNDEMISSADAPFPASKSSDTATSQVEFDSLMT